MNHPSLAYTPSRWNKRLALDAVEEKHASLHLQVISLQTSEVMVAA
jgi:hypothetical protein